MRHPSLTELPRTRRRLLQGTVGATAGVLAWYQGWPHLGTALAQKGAPSGQMTWAIHVTIAPTWFDPGETTGVITPFMFLYALHDALVKPIPDGPMSPCLATKWSESADGLTYDFELRQEVMPGFFSGHIRMCLGYTEPEGGSQIGCPTAGQLSETLGLNVTNETHESWALVTIRSAGQAIAGGVLSSTTTLDAHELAAP